ncbi:MAG: helix-turn-helix transcriptional regulator [Oscillospiraceae bacterium]|nr:helix-turn-helix transcriptional regulator [Oscillospiraceae bacterium]
MDYEKFFSERLVQLRLNSGVSARDMSLSMGQSQGYINKIESHQNLPSMAGFFYICEYLGITPMEFFDEKANDPKRIKEITEKLQQLTDKQLSTIEIIIDTMLHPE